MMAQASEALTPPIDSSEVFAAMQALVRLWHAHQRPIVVQLAGITGGEGTTSIATALAGIVHAETNAGILLVSFDRDTAPGEAFEPKRMIERAAGQAKAGQATGGRADKTGLMQARMHPTALRSAIAGRLDLDLDQLPPEIGLILLDTEPLLNSLEASAISSLVDGVIVVVCASDTSADAARRAIAAIRSSGGLPLGVIVNHRRYRVPGWLAWLTGQPVSPSKHPRSHQPTPVPADASAGQSPVGPDAAAQKATATGGS